jgi:hypothetical protein
MRALKLLFWILPVFACASCSSTVSPYSTPLKRSGLERLETLSIQPLWKTRLTGYPIDIALDSSGRELAVATIPSTDRVGGSRKSQLFWFGPNGKIRWRKESSVQTRAISMARDGSLLVISNYDDEILAYNSAGQQLWSAHGVCKPYALSSSHRVVCYHDDDAEPKIAFDIFDWNGHEILSREATTDIVALKISRDEKKIAIGLVHGKVLLYGGEDFHPLAQAQVPGEITDLSPANSGETAIIFRENSKLLARRPARIIWMDPDGLLTDSAPDSVATDQIALTPSGKTAYTYGNSDEGQFLSAFHPQSRKPSWSFQVPQGARYDQQVVALGASDGVIAVLESTENTKRTFRVVAYGDQGQSLWAIPTQVDEGAYFYCFSINESAKTLAVASDDGRIAVYSPVGM